MRHSSNPTVLVVEDDRVLGESLVHRLSLEGYSTSWHRTMEAALRDIERRTPGLVLCDIRLPDGSGEVLFRTLEATRRPPFLFMTAYGEIDQAVRLIRGGAGDYVTKPFAMDSLLERLGELIDRSPQLEIGVSPASRTLERALNAYAQHRQPVLLTGEVGVGKEYCARLLHGLSARHSAPFISVNCALLPADVLDREVFGDASGQGGANASPGSYIERARRGTLYVDGVARLSDRQQARFVDILERQAAAPETADVDGCTGRFVFACRREPDDLAESGSLRTDLYRWLGDRKLLIPPLRERPEDIRWLVDRFLSEFSNLSVSRLRGLSTAAEDAAMGHDWPRNTAELRMRMERAVGLALGEWITPLDLFPEKGIGHWRDGPSVSRLSDARDVAERREIERALALHDGHLLKASKTLGISRTTLWEKMKRHGIDQEP